MKRMTGEEIPKAQDQAAAAFPAGLDRAGDRHRHRRGLVWHRMQDYGPEITVTFNDGGGLRVGQTPVRYRGVQVGEVTGVALSKDEKNAVVRIRLTKFGEGIAREGSEFWIVRPHVGFGQVTGLSTVLSGPEIAVIARQGGQRTQSSSSAGLESPPVGARGRPRIILRAERPKMRVDAPVYYRGVEVGVVHKLDLAPNALSADVHVVIYPRYVNLVREGSAFWDVSGRQRQGRHPEGRRGPVRVAARLHHRRHRVRHAAGHRARQAGHRLLPARRAEEGMARLGAEDPHPAGE